MRSIVQALVLATLLGASTAVLSQPIKLKYAEFSPDTEKIHNEVSKAFVAAVNKEAAGVIEIEMFPNGALGRSPQQQAQMVLDGVTDFAFVVPAFTPGRFPETEVFELPGLFDNLKEATQVYTRLVTAGKLKDYEQFYPVALWGTPPFSIHANYPINTIADLKGRRIRGAGVIQIEALKALGAVTVGMPPTEIAEAINRRTIDGTTSQPTVVFDFGLDRVTNSHYFVRLGFVPLTIMMNRKKFESLPKAGQDAIRKFSQDWMARRYNDVYAAYDAELVKRLQSDPKRTVVIPGAADREAARLAFEPLINAWIAKSARNGELYKMVKAELELVRSAK